MANVSVSCDVDSSTSTVHDDAYALDATDHESTVLGARRRLKPCLERRARSEASLAASSATVASKNSNGMANETTVDEETSTESSSIDESLVETPQDGAIPRWKALEEKRLALCRKRVQLERRLFESALSESTPSATELAAPSPVHLEPHTNAPLSEQSILQWSGHVDATTGLATGPGRMVFSDGQVYEGSCHDGVRHGRGRNTWPSPTCATTHVYTGEWVRGHRDGRGTHCWPDGRTVTGTWHRGHLHGRVFFAWPDGASYDGDTAHGIKQGRGTHTWADGRVYSGQYHDGYEHGVGMLTEASRCADKKQHSQYRGQFQHGARHGYGIQIWPTKTYDGEWLNNVVHGTGKLTWNETGASYTGQFYQGVYHGVGCYTSAGNKYVGHWHFGVKQGKGKRHWSDGRVYEGSFRHSRPCGYGRMTYPNGATYTGGWLDGEFSGWGIAMAVDGTTVVHCGLWSHNRPVLAGTENQGTTACIEREIPDDCSTPVKPTVETCHDTLKLRCHSFDDLDWDAECELWNRGMETSVALVHL